MKIFATTGLCAAILAASVSLSFAVDAAGGTGTTGNKNNDPAAIQGTDGMNKMAPADATGAIKPDAMGTTKMKDCGVAGENQGTKNPATATTCN